MVARRVSFLLVALFISLCLSPLLAQRGTAKLEGTVRDTTGAVIPGVSVTVLHVETGVARETITNDSGAYLFSTLPAGEYTLTAEQSGFKRTSVSGLKLDVASVVVRDLELEIGDLSQEVTVTAEGSALIQTTSAEIASTVTGSTIKNLPLNGRQPLELIQISAGVAGNFAQSEQGSAADQDRNVGGLGVNGARAVNNAIYQDGVDITNSEHGAAGDPDSEQFGIAAGTDLQVSVDAIQEFRVISLNPTAEYGKNSGAQIEIVTMSGTNEFHGSVYWFHRNTVLNANKFFNNLNGIERERLLRNQYGGSIGGPVKFPRFYDGENRTFFFFNWEGFKERSGSAVTRTVLTQEARNGVFRYNLAGPNSTALVDPKTGALLPGVAVGQMDAAALDLSNWEGIGRDSSGVIARYIQLMPLPNDFGVTGGDRDGVNFAGFRFNANDPVDRHNWVAKVDHSINSIHSLTGRFSQGKVTSLVNLAPYPGLPSRDRVEEQHGVSLGWTALWAASTINEARLGFTRNTRELGTVVTNPGDIIIDCDDAFDCLGITNPDLTGEQSFNARQTLQFSDTFTWTRGDHELKFGYTYRTNPLNVQGFNRQLNVDFNTEPRNQQGSAIDLPTVLTGSPTGALPIHSNDRIPAKNFFNFITGRVGGVLSNVNASSTNAWGDFGTGRIRGFRQQEHSWFVQDTWRVTPTLTVNLGLRHEIFLVPYEVNSFFTQPVNRNLIDAQLADPAASCNSFGQADANNRCEIPFVQFGAVGPRFGTQVHPSDWNNFAPVVGFSWDPFGDGKTAVRASYRISYDKIFTATLNELDDDAPGLQIASVINGDALRDARVTNFIAPGGTLVGQARVPRLSDLKGSSIGGIGLNGAFDLAGHLSTPGANIPVTPLGPISLTRNSFAPTQFAPDFTTAYAQSWSLSLQREIMRNTALEVRYLGRKGIKEYLGLPANEFSASPDFNRQIQELQFLITGGELGLRPSALPSGFVAGTPLEISSLFGTRPNTATSFSQFTPGVHDTYAFQQFSLLYPFFLASRNSFASNIASAILRNDWVSTIASFDNRTDFLSSAFLQSVPLGAVPSGKGLNVCPPGRDPGGSRQNFGCLPIIVGIPEHFFRASAQFLNGPRLVGNSAFSDYHALQIELTRRMTDGLQLQTSYAFSKNLDITSVTQPTGQDIVSFFCVHCDRSLSDNDLTHDFKVSGIWEVPVGRNRSWGGGLNSWADSLLGGWSVAGFLSASSDFPMNVAVNGRDRTAPASTAGIRPSVREGFQLTSDTAGTGKVEKRPDGIFYFSSAELAHLRNEALQRTLIGNLGNVPRNFFRGPGWFNVDMMLMKSFNLNSIGEDWMVDFRAEFFNVLNSTNFANPSLNADQGPYVDLSKADAGQIIDTLGNPRLIQFALKLSF